jgi:hypothetical protein
MLVSFTASASPTRGHTETDVEEMMALFDGVLEHGATEKTASRMVEILTSGKLITASMRATMVKLDTPGEGVAKVADAYWHRERAKRPKAKKRAVAMHIDIAPSSRRS